MPDRVVGIKQAGDQLEVLTHDGTLARLDAAGKTISQKVLTGEELEKNRRQTAAAPLDKAVERQAPPNRLLKLTASGANGRQAIAFWGGFVRIVNTPLEQCLPQDVTAMVWAGEQLICGLADGQVLALTTE